MKLKKHKNLDYNYIGDGIYIGTNQCCAVHFDKELLRKGISADISLEDKRIDQPFGVDFYLWLPTRDHTPPSKDQIELGVEVLTKLVASKRKIYVHCRNGHGRAPTLVAAYLIKKGETPTNAVELIKKKRTSIHLETSQIKSLEKFYNKINK